MPWKKRLQPLDPAAAKQGVEAQLGVLKWLRGPRLGQEQRSFQDGEPRAGGPATDIVPRRPGDVGASAIGHFSWWKPPFRQALWRERTDWLHTRADAVSNQHAKAGAPTLVDKDGSARPEAERGGRRAVLRADADVLPRAR